MRDTEHTLQHETRSQNKASVPCARVQKNRFSHNQWSYQEIRADYAVVTCMAYSACITIKMSHKASDPSSQKFTV